MAKRIPYVLPAVIVLPVLFFVFFTGATAETGTPSELLAQAQDCRANGNYNDAEAIYQDIIATYPQADEAFAAQTGLVTLYIEQGSDSAAEAAFSVLVTDFFAHPALTEAVSQIADSYWYAGRHQRSVQTHQYNVQNLPPDEHTMYSQASLVVYHILQGDLPAADAGFEKLTTDFAEQPGLTKQISRIADRYWLSGYKEKSVEAHLCNADNFPPDEHTMHSLSGVLVSYIRDGDNVAADAACERLIADFSGRPGISKQLYGIAGKYWQVGKRDKSAEVHRYNVQNFPPGEYTMLSQRGIVGYYILQGYPEDAETAYEKLLTDFADQPRLPREIAEVAKIYNFAGDYARAAELYDYVAANWPENENTLGVLAGGAAAKIGLGDFQGAEQMIDLLKDSFADNPELGGSLNLIADTYRKKWLTQEAIELYEYVGAAFPEHEAAMWAQAGVAMCHIDLNDHQQVLADVDTLIADYNDVPRLSEAVYRLGEEYYNLAQTMEKQGLTRASNEYFDRAAYMWEKIIYSCPPSINTARASSLAAYHYEQQKKYETALGYYTRVVRDWPDYKNAWHAQFMIARCYDRMAEREEISEEEAAQHIEQACRKLLQDYPGSPGVGGAQQLLEKYGFNE